MNATTPVTQKTRPLRRINELTCIFIFALFFGLLGNIAFWRQALQVVPPTSVTNLLFLASLLLFILCSLFILFLLFLWSPLLKPVLTLLLLTSAGINYFCVTYGIYIDREMITNATRTNAHETLSLITPQFCLWIFLLGIIPALILYKLPIRKITSPLKNIAYRITAIAACIVLIAIAIFPLYKEYASFFRNNKEIVKLITPTNYISAIYSFSRQYIHSRQPFRSIGTDAAQIDAPESTKPTLFILVVGETARAQNFSLFGYHRNTNPQLSQQNNLLAFQNTSSCGTATATSVPCMFSNMTRDSYSATRAESQENLMDILQRADINVYWKNNNTGCQGICLRIPNTSITSTPNECPNGFCHDEFLLNGLDTYIAEHAQKDMVIVLHTIGSHGPSYYQRYPETTDGLFSPACDTNQIQNCSQEALTNVYDNTIVYTDHVLNQIIELLKTYNSNYETAMLYLSDHGESLGENGMYLHSAPYIIAPKEQTHVPMIFWSSPEFLAQRNINYDCMQTYAQTGIYSQDNLFHTMLGVMRVSTSEYNPEYNLFTSCQNPIQP